MRPNYTFKCIPMLKVPLSIRPSNKAKYLRQSATLTTFGNLVFDKLIENIAAIYAIFKRAVRDNISENAVYSMYEDSPAIDVANRYFSPRGRSQRIPSKSGRHDIHPHRRKQSILF